jgi:S-adenosylmethionine-diacylglycerol 3-amino-3-carboxypropyl transferase
MSERRQIKYANCWEDADLLLTAVPNNAKGNFFSIASGGDNSLALLTKNPKTLIVVDMNAAQLYLLELKIAAFKFLEYEELLSFLGIHESEKRLEVYRSIRKGISEEAQVYWDGNLGSIAMGVLHSGKFEKYFHLFRTKVLPWIHSRQTIQHLLAKKTAKEQNEFYADVWNSWRWRFLFKLFFSKNIMGRFGRTKEYLNQVEVPVAAFIFDRAEKQLSSTSAQENYFLNYIFTSKFAPKLPFYLRREHFETIRRNLGKISLFHGRAEDAFKLCDQFDFLNLSNIFEYMDRAQFESFERELRPKISQKGMVAYWNLMVDRQFSVLQSNFYESLPLNQDDFGFFYKRFNAEQFIGSSS